MSNVSPPSSDEQTRARQTRWRLVLGDGVESTLGGLSGEDAERDAALAYLYNREYSPGRNVRGGHPAGDLGESRLTVPEWINHVHRLFPQKTIERIERDALERYQLQEMVTNPDLLARAQPSQTLLKAVLHTKHLMNEQVLALARDLVRRVVAQLMEKLASEVRQPFSGALDRRRRSLVRVAKNFDIRTTLRRNLKHWRPDEKRLVLQTPHFYSRVRRQTDRWQLVILVDESGSMLDSVIHAAITAACFWNLRALRTHLVLFDTAVVDVTEHCVDPVETLMKVQLGGGTDIGRALNYAHSLIDNPRRAIVLLVTDFFEGAPVGRLYAEARRIIGGGSTLLGLAALDPDARPRYDEHVARQLAQLGAHVGAMTPGELAEWIAQKVG
ncbi:Mg-chelatase subunit ChlD [Ereboglobus sp. PH5-10]|uniref:VWA domain-containing protein n=1 Tax=Ereboglobus sp. PH5-10 TaxID=2940629 RepID=UPI002406D1B1|nr:VWA domain-containing protein [Ereboglobus sp. PH5-10]MDF9826847.1 Mg-chelatase subunit ChlD [Ereboglobus sp. PH5-10]